MMPNPRSVRTIYVVLLAFLLGFAASLLSGVFYVEAGPGYVDKGFPVVWERVYGGVTSIYNYAGLFLDVVFWSAVLFVIVFLALKYGLHYRVLEAEGRR